MLVIIVNDGSKLKNLGILSSITWRRPHTSSCNFVLDNFPANFFTKISDSSYISTPSYPFWVLIFWH